MKKEYSGESSKERKKERWKGRQTEIGETQKVRDDAETNRIASNQSAIDDEQGRRCV